MDMPPIDSETFSALKSNKTEVRRQLRNYYRPERSQRQVAGQWLELALCMLCRIRSGMVMRILVISNFYPPYYIGGYELGCRDVVEGLKNRGHEVKVLTSTYGIDKPKCDKEVYRWLRGDPILSQGIYGLVKFAAELFLKELNNQMAFKRLCNTFRPDVVYAWNLAYISVSLAFVAQRMGLPICYFVSDNWLSFWERDPWYSVWNLRSRRVLVRLVARLLRPFLNVTGLLPPSRPLDLRHSQFASQYLKQFALQAGKPVADAKVIHWGVDINRFPYKRTVHEPKRLLYVGQIAPQKGVHTAIEAMRVLIKKWRYPSSKLTIVGGSILSDYSKYVQDLVRLYDLEENITFVGFVQREQLPSIYHNHDILIFPSIWDEPFSITLLEAMSCGLAVVGTATGGSSEILQHEVNALVFPKEDAEACAAQMLRLMEDLKLFEKIRQNARHIIEEKFNFKSMLEKVENSIYEVVGLRDDCSK